MISKISKLKNLGIFHNRFFLLIFFGLLFILLNWWFVGELFPSPDINNLWFYSGIFMVLFEPFQIG